MSENNPISFHILLVEDNEGDIILTSEALNDDDVNKQIAVVRDGELAMQYLSKQPPYTNAVTPDLILLDINLPKISGKEVLMFIKNDTALKMIPVIMLTTSTSENDLREAYLGYANCYISKPLDLNEFFTAIKHLVNFWFHTVRLPQKS